MLKSLSLLILSLSFFIIRTTATPYPTGPLKPVFLVTTPQRTPSSNSSLLHSVSATCLFDPYHQPNFLLRLTGPGYGSLPNFTLTDGTLHTTIYNFGPPAMGTFEYNSTLVLEGQELQFLAAPQGKGNLALVGGYLLAVDGAVEGWEVCVEELGQSVVSLWKSGDATCNATYIQAVTTPPY
ncbi:uncharacterized protein BDZ99DRAFT_379703 [Mytilinidion resinicola]|uniref:Pullulan synthetase n=1 Tax=Mytilinidion resinicola TaxID=574789 RepID=A0A6A6Z0I4_9PEZI|nr:uncharacterized protein BDZ99DRAFT_379703 [Mytilinidion resinicola]KAF2814213.1 hypothetical protein BDZ99DRAFT_379703 [Mytilinidion resinicola]